MTIIIINAKTLEKSLDLKQIPESGEELSELNIYEIEFNNYLNYIKKEALERGFEFEVNWDYETHYSSLSDTDEGEDFIKSIKSFWEWWN